MYGGLLYKLFFLNTLSPLLINLLIMITHAAGLSKFLGKIRSPEGIYKAEDEYYFIRGGMGVTTVGHNHMEIFDSKPNAKHLSNKVRIVSIEEVYFCTAFVGGGTWRQDIWFDERRQWVLQQVQDPCRS